ncbi:hypothetical protein [Actinoplanes sp. NPDC026619]|uniref:hypothetical protein n=1 Tax=Actinoplanes sp. NPDC026619 TaxID=3155798 RepID=UPI0034000547
MTDEQHAAPANTSMPDGAGSRQLHDHPLVSGSGVDTAHGRMVDRPAPLPQMLAGRNPAAGIDDPDHALELVEVALRWAAVASPHPQLSEWVRYADEVTAVLLSAGHPQRQRAALARLAVKAGILPPQGGDGHGTAEAIAAVLADDPHVLIGTEKLTAVLQFWLGIHGHGYCDHAHAGVRYTVLPPADDPELCPARMTNPDRPGRASWHGLLPPAPAWGQPPADSDRAAPEVTRRPLPAAAAPAPGLDGRHTRGLRRRLTSLAVACGVHALGMAIAGTALTTLLIPWPVTWPAGSAVTVALLAGFTAASTVTLALISVAAATGRRGHQPSTVLAITGRLVQAHLVAAVAAAAATAVYTTELLLVCLNCAGFAVYAWVQLKSIRDAITRYHHAAAGIP